MESCDHEPTGKKTDGAHKRQKETLKETECLCWKQFTKTGCAESRIGKCKFVHFYDDGQSGFMASPVQREILRKRVKANKGIDWEMHLFREYVPKMDMRGLM